MDRKIKFGGLVVLALVPLLIAASGGFPSRPRFQSVTVVGATATGSLTIGGVAAATSETGTFVATQVGCAGGASTPTVEYQRTGRIVYLELPTVACTSTSTSWQWTGLPASLRPTTDAMSPAISVINNGAANYGAGQVFVESTGTLTFLIVGSSTGWTAANAKGLSNFTGVTYGID